MKLGTTAILIIIIITGSYIALNQYDTAPSALQCIITPVNGYNFQWTNLAPWGASTKSAYNIVATAILHIISFTSYRVPIYTPGSRAAMWIKCLAEGQKCDGLAGFWTGDPVIQSPRFNPLCHHIIFFSMNRYYPALKTTCRRLFSQSKKIHRQNISKI